MATSPMARAASSREQSIEAIESRIKLLTVLTDALAEDPVHQDKVRQAREHILELRQEMIKLRSRRGPAPKTPCIAVFA